MSLSQSMPKARALASLEEEEEEEDMVSGGARTHALREKWGRLAEPLPALAAAPGLR
jgi:hypothetical protein